MFLKAANITLEYILQIHIGIHRLSMLYPNKNKINVVVPLFKTTSATHPNSLQTREQLVTDAQNCLTNGLADAQRN